MRIAAVIALVLATGCATRGKQGLGMGTGIGVATALVGLLTMVAETDCPDDNCGTRGDDNLIAEGVALTGVAIAVFFAAIESSDPEPEPSFIVPAFPPPPAPPPPPPPPPPPCPCPPPY